MLEEALEKYKPPLPPDTLPDSAIKLKWSGTAAFQFDFKGCSLLIDPYVTRGSIPRMLFLPLAVNESLCHEVYPRADHILIGHSHFDHLQDVPAVAKHTGATIHGSQSTINVCKGAGIDPAKLDVITTGEQFSAGPFDVTFYPGEHGKAFMGRVPFQGEIEEIPAPPLRAGRYRIGGMFNILLNVGGMRILHIGSAGIIDDVAKKTGPVDLLLLCLAGRQGTPDYLARSLSHYRPRYLIAHHYDNFFKPLKNGRLPFKAVALDEFIQEYEQTEATPQLLLPDFFQPLAFNTEKKELI